jgi:uncharacterized protein YegP (UPF0339 family)
MDETTATLIAAIIAASVAALGLAWSVVSFFVTRRAQQADAARQEWARRYEQALAQALSADARESAAGLILIQKLSKARWASDEDRATAASVLSSLSPSPDAAAAHIRAVVVDDISDRSIADQLAHASNGPRGRFELYRDRAGEYRWRLKAGNGETLAVGEGHNTKEAALRSIDMARRTLSASD